MQWLSSQLDRLRDGARDYGERGWRIAPAHYVCAPGRHRRAGRHRPPGEVCSCRDTRCTRPGAHPLSPTWAADATYDPSLIAHLWYGPQPWNVLLPTGDLFDVWQAPLDVASRALDELRAARRAIGPVAYTPLGEWMLFTRARLGAPPLRLPDGLPLTYHGPGSYVLAPPSQLAGASIRWWRPPSPIAPRLPRWEPIVEALQRAARSRHVPEAHDIVPVPRAG